MVLKNSALDKVNAQIEALTKQKAALRKEQASRGRLDQKKREAIIGQSVFKKAGKGSPEHQAILVSYIESINTPREHDLFKELAEKLGVKSDCNEEKDQEETPSEELSDPSSPNIKKPDAFGVDTSQDITPS